MPGEKGRYSIREVLAWKKARDGDEGDSKKSKLKKLEEEYAQVRLDLAKLKLKKEEGKSVDRDEVDRVFAARAGELKQNLMNTSHSLGPILAPAMEVTDVQAQIDDRMISFLEQYSRPLPDELVSPDRDSEEDLEAPAKPKRGRPRGNKKSKAKRARKSRSKTS